MHKQTAQDCAPAGLLQTPGDEQEMYFGLAELEFVSVSWYLPFSLPSAIAYFPSLLTFLDPHSKSVHHIDQQFVRVKHSKLMSMLQSKYTMTPSYIIQVVLQGWLHVDE